MENFVQNFPFYLHFILIVLSIRKFLRLEGVNDSGVKK